MKFLSFSNNLMVIYSPGNTYYGSCTNGNNFKWWKKMGSMVLVSLSCNSFEGVQWDYAYRIQKYVTVLGGESSHILGILNMWYAFLSKRDMSTVFSLSKVRRQRWGLLYLFLLILCGKSLIQDMDSNFLWQLAFLLCSTTGLLLPSFFPIYNAWFDIHLVSSPLRKI